MWAGVLIELMEKDREQLCTKLAEMSGGGVNECRSERVNDPPDMIQ